MDSTRHAFGVRVGVGTPGSVVALLIRPDRHVCSVSRRWKPHDLGLPGGKIEPGETPEEALRREVLEEIGVEVVQFEYVYERVDMTDGKIAWCYRIYEWWQGIPRQMEPGIFVSWETCERLLEEGCTFRDYNLGLFRSLGLVT